ncbi:MAG TPA: pentapeptide repeat-containing protein [Acidobacteriaceae bacterium]|nr:pentapeptide repeat-containing protein [Acidobacteriaceae bacterium]
MAKLNNGEHLDFITVTLTKDEPVPPNDADRVIPALWIEELLEPLTRAARRPIAISHAIIDGPLNLAYATFDFDVCFIGCLFMGSVNGSFASFKRVISFRECRFLADTDWRGASIETDLNISGAQFVGKASFQEIRIGRAFRANGTQFENVSFEGAEIRGAIDLSSRDKDQRTSISGEANLRSSRLGGIYCFGTEFKRGLDLNSARIDGDVFLKPDHHGNPVNLAGNCDLRSMHVEGNLELSGLTFEGEADFESLWVGGDAFFASPEENKRAVFTKSVDFRAAHIGGNAEFFGAVFLADASFVGFSVGGDVLLRSDKEELRTTFNGEVDFTAARVAGDVDFGGVLFAGAAVFSKVVVAGYLSCSGSEAYQTVFRADASFSNAHIGGNANFDSTKFEGVANFNGMRTEGHAFFRSDSKGNRTVFSKDFDFRDVDIKHVAEFDGTDFQGNVIFNRAHIGSSAYFRTDRHQNRTTFHRALDFINGRIGGNAEFSGAIFEGEAKFYNVVIDSDAYFNRDVDGKPATFHSRPKFLATIFSSDALFTGADFREGAVFSNSHFKGEALFAEAIFGHTAETRFIHTRFGWGGNFEAARFAAVVDFTGTIATGDTHFAGARFAAPCIFRDAAFQVLHFDHSRDESSLVPSGHRVVSKDPAHFSSTVDFRGLTYERIYVNIESLVGKLEPFARQPYRQLEATLRKAGDDEYADRIYLSMRRVERQRKFRRSMIVWWLFDWLYKLVANYGIRPLRLMLYGIALVGFGAFFFSQPGAIELKKADAPAPTVTQAPPHEGTYVSIRTFLPIDVPVGSGWAPVSHSVPIRVHFGRHLAEYDGLHPDWYGTLLRVAGTLLVGLALATVTGLLRRLSP